ncbi:MAG: 4-hydroxythreonine-4-phosphate dehydrogenase PdxA, partial [Muribaculaceae bacterium]|nr:4-hydroxythreonine-4-phosphate dehydrogenase PdxA [Muribaculaceae bacterium]
MDKIKVALTQGDTNGVGLEVVLKALCAEGMTELFTPILFANHGLVKHTLRMIGADNVHIQYIDSASKAVEGRINVVNVGKGTVTAVYGEGTPISGAAAVESLVAACNCIDDEDADVLVTAPIDKGAAQVDGFKFAGHTEFLQERFGDDDHRACMILFNDDLRVMLLTTHVPVSEIARHINKDRIVERIEAFNRTLTESFEIERPRIAVLSLNPHNGDHGLLGREEIDEIIPAIE